MTTLQWRYPKDPADVLDYVVDATAWLDGDTLTGAAITAPAGITIDSHSFTAAGVVTLWLRGGTAELPYPFVLDLDTMGGRHIQRTSVLWVKDR